MDSFIFGKFYIILSIALGVVSQLIVKWRMSSIAIEDSDSVYEKFTTAIFMLLDPYIIISIGLTFIAGLAWMIAMTKFDISYAYPFTILGFVLVLLFSALLFNEPVTIEKIVGILLIATGVIVSSRSI